MKRTKFAAILLLLAALGVCALAKAHIPPLPPHDKLLRAIYQELIEINTTVPSPITTM